MNLSEFNNNLEKPWLNIKCNTLVTHSASIDQLNTNLLTLNNQGSVPNAPINATNFFSNGSSNLLQTDNLGNTVNYFSASNFNGGCGGFIAPYTLNTPLSGSTTSATNFSSPSSYWTLGDCKLTYNGPSGQIYFYGTGCGFLTDTIGTYQFSIVVNGSVDPSNLNVIYAGATTSVTTGQITGTKIFNTGDFIQVQFNKGSDIPGAPVINLFGMGFVVYRTG